MGGVTAPPIPITKTNPTAPASKQARQKRDITIPSTLVMLFYFISTDPSISAPLISQLVVDHYVIQNRPTPPTLTWD